MKQIKGVLFAIVVMFLMAACSGEKAVTWQEQYDLGMQYLTDGDYEAAIVAFTAAIEIDAKEIQVYTGLAQAYIGTGDYEAAVLVAGQGAEVLSDSGQEQADGAVDEFTAVLLTLGELCLEDGQYELAITVFSLAIEINPELVDAYIGRAEAYLELGEQEKALEDYGKALELLQQGESGSITEEELEALIVWLTEVTQAEESYIDDTFSEKEVNGEDDGIIYVLIEEYDVYADGSRILTCEYTHDESGTILTKTTYELGPDGTYVTEYFYTEENELPVYMYVLNDSGEIFWSEKYIYDDKRNLISLVCYSYDIENVRDDYTYDEYGNVLSHYYYHMGEFSRRSDYQYI